MPSQYSLFGVTCKNNELAMKYTDLIYKDMLPFRKDFGGFSLYHQGKLMLISNVTAFPDMNPTMVDVCLAWKLILLPQIDDQRSIKRLQVL